MGKAQSAAIGSGAMELLGWNRSRYCLRHLKTHPGRAFLLRRERKTMMKRTFLALVVTAGVLALAQPTRAVEGTLRDKYRAVQVDRFDISEGVQFPVDYLLTLQEAIITQLQKLRSFGEVLRPGEDPADPSAAVLRLTGTITRFEPGSRAKRYIGIGMGRTRIYARLAFLDRTAGKILIAEQVRSEYAGGFMGGESLNVTRDFAQKVASSTKLVLEKRLPAPGEAAATLPSTSAKSEKVDRHVVTLSSKDFEGTEKKLNEEAANGFCLADFAVMSSKTADLTMEKVEGVTQPHEYRIVHTRLPGNLKKNLNKAATEGFRLRSHTLGQFGGVTAVIMEKATQNASSRCQYQVYLTMRISSMQSHIQKDQTEGYVLAETLEAAGGMHIAILEKTMEKSSE